jgi:hypothetical protein
MLLGKQMKLVDVEYAKSCKSCKYWGKCTSEVCRTACLDAEKYRVMLLGEAKP